MEGRQRAILLGSPAPDRLARLREAVPTADEHAYAEALTLSEVQDALRACAFDAYLLDANLDDAGGRTLLALADAFDCHAPILLLAERADLAATTALLRRGASDCLAWDTLDATTLDGALRLAFARAEAEAAHLQTGRRFRHLIEHAQDIITVISPDATMRYVSPAAERVLGHPPDFYIGKIPFQFIHDDDHDRVFQALAEVLAAPGEVRKVCYRFRHRDESWRMLESVGSAIVRDDGEVEVVVNSRDVTQREMAEMALRASEARLRNLTDSAVDAIVTADTEGRVLTWNRGAERLFGYAAGEIIGRPVSALMPARYVEAHETGMARFVETGEGYVVGQTIEMHGLHQSGAEFPVELALSTWTTDDQRFFSAIVRDVTERRRAEQSLRESEAFSRALIDALPDAMLLIAPDGTFSGHKASAGYEWLVDPETFAGKRFTDILPPDMARQMAEAHGRARETGTMQTVEYGVEINGETHFREARFVAYGEGRVLALLRDFTGWKRAEQRLRESETKFRDLFENSPDAVFVESLDGLVLDVNEAACRLHGYTREELLGRHVLELIPEEQHEVAWRFFERMAAGRLDYFEGFSWTADGRTVPVELRVRRLIYENQPALLLHVRDVTERRQAEAALRQREAILGAAAFMAERLLKTHRWEACLIDVLARLGTATGVSRVYVFENHDDEDGAPVASQRFEWAAPGTPSQADNPELQGVPWHGAGFDRWYQVLGRGEAVIGRAATLPPDERAFLEMQGVLSLAVVPINLDDRWWGFIGFDDCERERVWSEAETDALRTVANTLGVAIERGQAEQALRRSEAQNRAIIDALPDALVRLDRAGRYLEIRLPRGYAAFQDPDALIGRSAFELLPPHVAEPARASLERALETGEMQTFEYEIDVGSEVRVREGRVVPSGEDEVISIQRDITERKRAEHEVRRLKAFYEQVLDDLPADVAVLDPEGRMLYLNRASVADDELRQWLIGKTAEDYCRRRGLDMEIAHRRARLVSQVVEERQAIRFEEKILNRHGETRHILRIASPVFGDDGAVRQVIGYGLDITDRKLAEEALRQSEALLRTVVSNVPVMLFAFDEQGVFTLAEGKGLQTFGLNPEEIVGQSAFERYRQFDGFTENLARVLQGEASNATLEVDDFAFEYWLTPLEDAAGNVRGAISVAADVTEMKRSERQLKASREQLRELALHLQSIREAERTRISREVHDQLGQALTALRMDVAWIEKNVEAEERFLRRFEAMKGLIDQTIQTVRRIASELRPGILDDLGLSAALEWQTQEFAARTGVRFAFTNETDFDTLDRNLSTAVFRVFQELLTNVARHAEASRIDVTLRSEDGTLVLIVRDNGRGIADLDLVHSKSLGMLGMRERTQAWGGHMAFESAPGAGTEVTVRIPLPELAPA